MGEFAILGQKVTEPTKHLETFPAPLGVREITLVSEEVTSVCPVTGQPDFSTVTITYRPDEWCLESKSLKLYLWGYRQEGVFCEALSSQICTDILAATNAYFCRVEIKQRPRGGISIEASTFLMRRWHGDEEEKEEEAEEQHADV